MNATVLITGGTRGIGRALAVALLQRGARVAICARQPGELPGALLVTGDVAHEGARIVADVVAQLGPIDVLISNAAIARGSLADVLATNVGGAEACARAVLARNPRARVINVSSGIVQAAQPDSAAYAASKHALEGLTRAMARDYPAATITCVQLGEHATTLHAHTAAAPPPEAAVPALLAAITATETHGRVTAAWRTERRLDTSHANDLAHPLGPAASVRSAIAAYAMHGELSRYAAMTSLPKLLAAEHGVPLDAIVLGAGASELLERILHVLVGRGERIVANAPSWPLFPHLCDARGVVPTTVPYRLRAGGVDHDLEAIAAAVDRTVRLVYLISPANPMGCALDDASFARFLAALPTDTFVLVDEAYGDFVTRDDAARAIAWTRRDPRVIAVRTFSKFHALAGLRIGYAVAAPAVARRLAAAALPFAVSELAQIAAGVALADRAHAAATHALLARGRRAWPSALPSDAPFALVEIATLPEEQRRRIEGARYFGGGHAMVSLWPTDVTDPTTSAPSTTR